MSFDEFGEALIAGFTLVVSILAISSRIRQEHKKKEIASGQSRYHEQLEERESRGEEVIQPLDAPPPQSAAVSNQEISKPAPPVRPGELGKAQAFATTRSHSGVQLTAGDMRRAVVMAEILGSRGGRKHR